jgi:hypothetical protein
MLKIHEKLFNTICDRNMDSYEEIICSLKFEYMAIINELKKSNNIPTIRFQVHKMISIVCMLDNNDQIIFLCKRLLSIEKNLKNKSLYEECLQYIFEYDRKELF